MKVAISVPNPTFEAAERVSKKLGVSRSEFYSKAVEKYVEPYRQQDVRDALAEVYGSEPSGVDPVLDELQMEALHEDW